MPANPVRVAPGEPTGLQVMPYTVGTAEVIALRGGIRSTDGDAIEAPIANALDRGHMHLVLDMHEVREAESGALDALTGAVRLAIRRGGSLSAVGLRPGLLPRIEPLVAAGLRLRGTVRAALTTEVTA